jgi:hypothetical protein
MAGAKRSGTNDAIDADRAPSPPPKPTEVVPGFLTKP